MRYPREMIEIECAKCGRHGRLRTARLLAEHGPDIKLSQRGPRFGLNRTLCAAPMLWRNA